MRIRTEYSLRLWLTVERKRYCEYPALCSRLVGRGGVIYENYTSPFTLSQENGIVITQKSKSACRSV